jgi:hypothetical protein
MSFLNPYFLLALAGVAVPVLIHILTRDRIQHVAFSTLRFFVKGAKHVIRRKKFQELILLLLRIAIAALLAFIFARPFLKSKVAAGQAIGTARIIVADVSGSMPAAFLKTEAQNAVAGADSVALIAFADAPQVVVPLTDKPSEVKEAAGKLALGFAGTNIAEALRKANELLRPVNAKHKEIVLISDLQREGWRYFKGDWKLGSDVKFTIVAAKPTGNTAGLAIIEGDVPQSLVLDKQPRTVSVRIANFADAPRSNVVVTMSLTGQPAETQTLNLRANGSAAARFRHVFETPGDNTGKITVGDSAFYFNARAIPRIPVLLVSGSNPFFLEKALAPSAESPFTVKTVKTATPQDIAGASVVVLANVGTAPVDALAALLARGGGLLFLPGDQVKSDAFNAQFGRVAPCKLRQVLTARPANGEDAESLTRVDFEHPIFEIFSRPHYGDLSLPKFARYWETSDTQLSRVLARFSDGRPAIIERQIGQGVSVALVSAVDPAWNNLVLQSVFLPVMHQTIRYLAVRTEQRTGYTFGEVLPVEAKAPGLYPTGTITYAVNANLAEANPATVSADEVAAAIERAPGEVLGALDLDAAVAMGGEKKDTGWWWWLLVGLVGLTAAELVIGNKTVRH